MTPEVRLAGPEDVPAAAAVLAEAFADYAWTRWTVDAADHEQRLLALRRLFLEEVALPFGRVDVGSVWMPGTGVPEDVWLRVGPGTARDSRT
ncbi:hypothetical protein [Candidatus Blastococcus massiliensis]|uniref:hypothetical protein n=1 Tax=Candidatus Blastococcus massiliensis TaxID=1470358 RepID=UPI0004B02E49|nr:hypothetical protein [Candidatus Blastococcus massiliensis]